MSLPVETFSLVLYFSSLESLRSLSMTCKSLYDCCRLPAQYRNVDLSFHNLGFRPFQGFGRRCCWAGPRWPPIFNREKLALKQQSFLSDMLGGGEHPVSIYVQDLTWTIRSHYLPTENSNKDLDEQMWQVFQRLTNVTRLDLGCYQESWEWDYLRSPPQHLFPNASDIRLSGIMYRQIVTAVLCSNSLSKLQRLTIDNLQDPGNWKNLYPFRVRIAREAGAQPNAFQDNDHQTIPGPMRGILPIIARKCISLEYFSFRKPGWTTPNTGLNRLYDEECYREVADFLRSVSPTLREFHFEHGIPESQMNLYKKETINSMIRPSTQRIMPMDAMLRTYVWPALKETKWPQLRKLAIKVGTWKGGSGIEKADFDELRGRFGDCVRVTFEDVEAHPCEVFVGSYK